MRAGETPSRRRFSSPSADGVSSRSASASVTIRLISSGMVRSKLRRPASTWATRDAQLGADQRAGERGVHVADDDDPVGLLRDDRPARRPPSRAPSGPRGSPEPTPRLTSGRGDVQLIEEHGRHLLVVMLAGVHQPVRHQRAPRPSAARCTQPVNDRRHLHEVGSRAGDEQQAESPCSCVARFQNRRCDGSSTRDPGDVRNDRLERGTAGRRGAATSIPLGQDKPRSHVGGRLEQDEATLRCQLAVDGAGRAAEGAVDRHTERGRLAVHGAAATDHQVRQPDQVQSVDGARRERSPCGCPRSPVRTEWQVGLPAARCAAASRRGFARRRAAAPWPQ